MAGALGALAFGVTAWSAMRSALVDSECKNGGWASFDYPRPFATEDDCEQYVKTGRQ